MRPRIIPCLSIDDRRLVKTVKFKNPRYIGDPINAVKIFNDIGVDEIIICDIYASSKGRKPNFNLIKDFASEAFMPLCYSGGVTSIEDIKELFRIGVEKIGVGSSAHTNMKLIRDAVEMYGSQSIVGIIDYKKNFWGHHLVYKNNGKDKCNTTPYDYAQLLQENGVGEIFLNSIDNDGKMSGYDIEVVEKVCSRVDLPVIVCGGCAKIEDLKTVIDNGASAAAASSIFIYHGRNKGILISYPTETEILNLFK